MCKFIKGDWVVHVVGQCRAAFRGVVTCVEEGSLQVFMTGGDLAVARLDFWAARNARRYEPTDEDLTIYTAAVLRGEVE